MAERSVRDVGNTSDGSGRQAAGGFDAASRGPPRGRRGRLMTDGMRGAVAPLVPPFGRAPVLPPGAASEQVAGG